MTVRPVRCNRGPRAARLAGALAAIALIAGCAQPPAPSAQAPAPQKDQAPAQAADATVDPSRPIPVALLVPLGAQGGAGAEAQSIADAARMAVEELGPGMIALSVHDTRGDAAATGAAARQALNGGAKLILGPLFGANVGAAAQPAAARGVNLLSFSTVPSAAGGNVWLAGELASDEAARIVSYAASKGLTRIGIFRPDTPYGDVAERAVRDAVYDNGAQLVAADGYERSFNGVQEASPRYASAHLAAGADAVVLPEEGDGLRAAASFLAYNGVTGRGAQFLGLGVWAKDPGVTRESTLQGGWFAAPDPFRLSNFESRFQARYGRRPTRLAHLGYDVAAAAVEMATRARLARDDTPFDSAAIVDPGGFDGAAGALRFTASGLNRRALAVLKVSADGFILLDQAPQSAPPGRPGS